MNKVYRPRGYIEGSRMSKALDFLAGEGIDCIGIGGTTRRGLNTADAEIETLEGGLNQAYLPINMLTDRNFLDEICYSNEGFITEDSLRIEIDEMFGDEIKKLNPKLSKLDNEKSYGVIKISYTDNRPFYIPDESHDPVTPYYNHKPISL